MNRPICEVCKSEGCVVNHGGIPGEKPPPTCDGPAVDWQKRCLDAEAERDEAKARNNRIVCVWCGWLGDRDSAVNAADLLMGHVATCDKRPEAKLAAALSSSRLALLASLARTAALEGLLRTLVTLKDGPRDEEYERDKGPAWEAARKALAPACAHRRRRVHDADCTANPLALQMCDCPGVAPCDVEGCSGTGAGERDVREVVEAFYGEASGEGRNASARRDRIVGAFLASLFAPSPATP